MAWGEHSALSHQHKVAVGIQLMREVKAPAAWWELALSALNNIRVAIGASIGRGSYATLFGNSGAEKTSSQPSVFSPNGAEQPGWTLLGAQPNDKKF